MRNLANSMARTAIDTSVRRRWAQAAVGKMMVGATAFGCGLALALWSEGTLSLTFLGSGTAFVVATFWLLQGAILFRNVLAARSEPEEPAAEETEPQAQTNEPQSEAAQPEAAQSEAAQPSEPQSEAAQAEDE